MKVQFTAEISCKETDSIGIKRGAALKWAYLKGANLEGANLEGAYLKWAYLKGANLEGAYLKWAYLKGANLKGAYLEGANLEGANLEGAYLKGAYLKGAYLEGAYLEGANLEGANLEGVPLIENIHQAVYAAASQCHSSLDMTAWHTCETTHCRAGWVVTLAGEEGKKLEEKIGTSSAAALIYWHSDPDLKQLPDFYCDNETAMADMKRLAEMNNPARNK